MSEIRTCFYCKQVYDFHSVTAHQCQRLFTASEVDALLDKQVEACAEVLNDWALFVADWAQEKAKDDVLKSKLTIKGDV